MQLKTSSKAKPRVKDERIESAIEVSKAWLRETVETISIPRHFFAESANNRKIRDWIERQFLDWGYDVARQGEFDNIVAFPDRDVTSQPVLLVGAHYDSVPDTPGADDNGSAVAAILGCAKAIASLNDKFNVCFVAFNREEDGLLGSQDFVQNYAQEHLKITEAHILEMVGFCDHTPGSQRLPSGLPVGLARNTGDFLALVTNRHSNAFVNDVLSCSKTYVPDFPVLGLKVFFGLEKRFADLGRSDHGPFWDAGLPAVMWTDTSEFRNPHYHKRSDTPDTLDYDFLRSVTQLLISYVMTRADAA